MENPHHEREEGRQACLRGRMCLSAWSPVQTLMLLVLIPAGICKSEGSCVQVWAPGRADNGDCRWSWLWVPCSPMQPQSPARGHWSEQRTLPAPREPGPPHSHLGSLSKHVWTPWPRLAPLAGACRQHCEYSGDAGLQLSFQRPPNPFVCSPSTTEGNRPCQACSVSACLKLSWVCTCTRMGLCVGTHECAWMWLWAATTRQRF